MENEQDVRVKVLNAFSLNMIRGDNMLLTQYITVEEARTFLDKHGFYSYFGHRNTAEDVSDLLCRNVVRIGSRETVKLRDGEQVLVVQYTGDRLEEHAAGLPVDSEIRFALCEVRHVQSFKREASSVPVYRTRSYSRRAKGGPSAPSTVRAYHH